MASTIEYKRKLKAGDVGDIFRITFDEDPPEFAFSSVTTASFHAVNNNDTSIKFSGSCVINQTSSSATYTTVSGNLNTVGLFKFEFEFRDNSNTFIQTYPKDREIIFDVVSQYD